MYINIGTHIFLNIVPFGRSFRGQYGVAGGITIEISDQIRLYWTWLGLGLRVPTPEETADKMA